MNKYLVLLLFSIFSCEINAQLSKLEHLKFITNNSDISIDSVTQFKQIYFVRFDYCSSSKFCGKNMFIELLDETNMPNTLFIVDTAAIRNNLPSKMLNKKVIYVSREEMMRSGLFCGYTILVNSKKRKVKWLD